MGGWRRSESNEARWTGGFLAQKGHSLQRQKQKRTLTFSSKRFRENLLLIQSASDDIATAEAEVNRKLTLDDEMIRLPKPRKMTAGWTTTYSFFPDTTRAEVQQYIAHCKYYYFLFIEIITKLYLQSDTISNACD